MMSKLQRDKIYVHASTCNLKVRFKMVRLVPRIPHIPRSAGDLKMMHFGAEGKKTYVLSYRFDKFTMITACFNSFVAQVHPTLRVSGFG
jgi:hypothetical protein